MEWNMMPGYAAAARRPQPAKSSVHRAELFGGIGQFPFYSRAYGTESKPRRCGRVEGAKYPDPGLNPAHMQSLERPSFNLTGPGQYGAIN
jgi:hypothetical protein